MEPHLVLIAANLSGAIVVKHEMSGCPFCNDKWLIRKIGHKKEKVMCSVAKLNNISILELRKIKNKLFFFF